MPPSRSSPDCAKIWDYLYKTDSDYADNIADICAKDMLSDSIGLTVIYPDKKFREAFKNNIHGDGNTSTARRMLGNTIIKRYLTDAKDWDAFSTTLPLRSGLTLPVTSTSGDTVVVGDGIKLKKMSSFKAPEAFKYAVWEVVDGDYPTTTEFTVKFKKRKPMGRRPMDTETAVQGGYAFSFIGGVGDWDDGGADSEMMGETEGRMTIGGGGKDVYMIRVGKLMSSSPDTLRVGIMASILNDYKNQLLYDKCARRNPLLIKAASLYNWLSMYYPNVLEVILPVTDIHPGVSLLLLLLDPQSPITVPMLCGTGNSNDPGYVAAGWAGAEITTDPYKEWTSYVNKASSMMRNIETTLGTLLEFRKKLVTGDELDYPSAASRVGSLYKELNVYPPATMTAMYTGGKNTDRKLWQDQMRFVSGCAFSGVCDAHIVTTPQDVEEQLKQAVQFRPLQGYTNAATFTVMPDSLTNQDEYYAFLKWLFSTDLMYLPVSLESTIATSTKAPYDGTDYSSITPKSILNNYYIRNKLLQDMKTTTSQSAQLQYAVEWAKKTAGIVPTSTQYQQQLTPSIGGIRHNEPLGSMQGVGYQQGDSNDFSYGQVLEVGQDANPGNYGETYSNTDSVPWSQWSVPVPKGGVCPGLNIEN